MNRHVEVLPQQPAKPSAWRLRLPSSPTWKSLAFSGRARASGTFRLEARTEPGAEAIAAGTVVVNSRLRWATPGEEREQPVMEDVEEARQRSVAAETKPFANVLGEVQRHRPLWPSSPKKRTPSAARIGTDGEALKRRRCEIASILAQAENLLRRPQRGADARQVRPQRLDVAQHGEIAARRLAQGAEERGQAASQAALRAGRASSASASMSSTLTPFPSCRCAAASITVPRCGVFGVSWVKLLIAA